jgi:hypothetical protein
VDKEIGGEGVKVFATRSDPTPFRVKFDPANPEAAGMVPVHLEGDAARRWLRRNSTHFVQIIVPRRPIVDVFRLTRFAG